MTAETLMKELESLGKEQTRKTYARHGITGNVFGVSYAEFTKLQKRIKTNQPLAEELWATGNHDARVLATKIADPKTITVKTLDGWVKDLENDVLSGAISAPAADSPAAQKLFTKWIRAKSEWTAITGWATFSRYAQNDNDLADATCVEYLELIEKTIHQSTNWLRYAMNNAVIAIGVRNPELRKRALAAAKRIGKVEVDHGATACKTPDAAPYIEKAWARRKQQPAGKKVP